MTDAAGMRRGRVFIRRLGDTTPDWRVMNGRRAGRGYGMVGVVEVDDDVPWTRERSHGFACLLTGSGGALAFSGSSDASEYGGDDAFCEMDHFLTSMRFPRADEAHEALGWGAGGMVLRDTRGPSSPGATLATVAIALCLPDDSLPDAHMASLRIEGIGGSARANITVEGPCALATTGLSLSQVHKLPLWGWDAEPFGFSSTMNLDAIDRCTRAQERMIAADITPEEERRLRAETQYAVQDNSDPVFAAFRRRAAKEGLVPPWDATPKASEILDRDRGVELLVKELLEMREREVFA